MSLLFKIENKIVMPHVETLLIPEFRVIWERDTTTTKDNAMEDFTYIEFMTSMMQSNPYSSYSEDDRKPRIIKDVIKRADWVEDEQILAAMVWMKKYQEEVSFTYGYYTDALYAAQKVRTFFRDFSMDAINIKTGNPLYKPKEITSAINDTDITLQKLIAMKQKVHDEIFDSIKNRAAKVVSPFANPASLESQD